MRWEDAVFELSAGISAQLPEDTLPEIAFSGRSNVGKSSLINRLTGRKALARTSATPGKTATINFYRLPSMRLVDLPGYGYAKVSIPFVVVLTKADKLNKTERTTRLDALEQELGDLDGVTCIPFSAVTGEGAEQLRDILLDLIEQ